MEGGVFGFRGGAAGRWRRKFAVRPRISVVSLLFFLMIFFLFFVILWRFVPWYDGIGSGEFSSVMADGEKFLFYAPHSGFSNQVSELKNGVLFAAILNRTLVVPPVLDHHAVALGSCPKFRVSSPSDLRAGVWDHMMELLRSRRFVSMADIVDLSSLVSSSMVRIVDFREFASALCGIDLNLACTVSDHESLPREFKQCKDFLSRPHFNDHKSAYGVEDDCRTTVWIYGQNSDGILDSFQPDEELKRRKKISFIRRRRDIYEAFGPGSKAESAKILAFGSLFSSPYQGTELHVDIHDVPQDSRIQSLLGKLYYLPFSKEILNAGKKFALNRIKEPFLCAQLRLLDGQFKNHWKETFSNLRQKIELITDDHGSISIFVMTDLPKANWAGTYLADLSRNTSYFKIFTLSENDTILMHASKKLISIDHNLRGPLFREKHRPSSSKRFCPPMIPPSILLYVQEAVCSCASLGFVGTYGSTIADGIEAMRKNTVCSSEPL